MTLLKTVLIVPGLRARCKINNPNPDQKTKRIDNPACLENLYSSTPKECCATAIIAQQSDYQAQRGQIQEIVEAVGHIVVFYPKFHCELNWIEYYWGACKRFARKHCDYTLPGIFSMVIKFVLPAHYRFAQGGTYGIRVC